VPTGAGLTRNASVSAPDIFAVIGRFNSSDTGPGDFNRNSDPLSTPNPLVQGALRANYHPAFDRGSAIGPNPWDLAPANGSVASTDIFSVLGQFNHAC
jgi:hypothetical protein